MQSRACSARMVSNITGIPYRRVSELRINGNPTDKEIAQLAALFSVTPQFMRDAMPVLREWSKARSSGVLPTL